MKKNPIQETKKIKEIVDFLNSEYSGLFFGMLCLNEQNKNLYVWHIVCKDFETYMHDQNLRISYEEITVRYPGLKLFHCYCSLDPTVQAVQESPRWKGEKIIFVK